MSFQTLNHLSHNWWGIRYEHGVVSKFRSSRAIAVPPSSILLQTDESGNLPKPKKSSGCLINQENTVGIIGGVSAESSLCFLRKLVQLSSKEGEPSLPFVLCSDAGLNKELLIYERSSLSLQSGKGKHSQFNQQPIIENLQRKRAFLECSGARCIALPCHVSHSWHDEVSRGCSVPFLHMGECVAKELKEAKLKPLEAGSSLRIGVLATSATLTAGFYQDRLQREGFEVVLPDKATLEHAVIPAIEAISRKDMEGARNLLRIALQVLLVRAVNNIILGSNDMWDLLPRDDPLLKKCVDPMDALARSIIKWAHSVQKVT